MKKIIIQLLFIVPVLFLFSCQKENGTNGGSAQANIHLTDAVGIYDHVYIDIQSVEVTMSGNAAITLLPIRAGVYDLLSFKNGLDTLLMQAMLPPGTVGQIRLILGPNNSVVANGISYPLNTPSAQESGLKLNLNQNFVAGGVYDIWIDFDAGKSILQTGNGSYKLKPVIRAYGTATNGRVHGYLLPLNAMAIVYATNGTDTISAIPNGTNGYFQMSGMAAGTYQLMVAPGIPGLQVYTQTNVQVSYNTQVDLGTITLHP